MQEQEIIRLMKQRDEHGAEAFLQYYTPLLRYVIAPILPNEKDQEDCLSEISLRVWNNIGSYDPSRGSWTAWLTALGRNAALNHARQARHTAGEEALSDQIPARELTPEAAALLKEQQEALQRALQRLSPGEKQLLYRTAVHRPDRRRAGHNRARCGGEIVSSEKTAAQMDGR